MQHKNFLMPRIGLFWLAWAVFGIALISAVGIISAGARAAEPAPAKIDLSQYAGKWYQLYNQEEHGRFESDKGKQVQFGDKGTCYGTTVEYALTAKGNVSVLNTCHKNNPQGKTASIKGIAFPVDETNSKLKVRFNPLYLRPFLFDYWILWVDPHYQLALIGNKSTFSILSREKNAPESLLKTAFEKATELGYDKSKVQKVGF